MPARYLPEEKVRTQDVLPSCDKNEKVSNEESAIKALPYGKHLSRLIIEHAHPLRFSDERIKWADEAARTLRIALAENGLSVTELKHVPTPNGCLVVFRRKSYRKFEGKNFDDSKPKNWFYRSCKRRVQNIH